MNTARVFIVHAIWDEEAQVWVATSEDVPGLVTEADTCEKLHNKLKVLIPELLIANGVIHEGNSPEIPFDLLTKRHDKAYLHSM